MVRFFRILVAIALFACTSTIARGQTTGTCEEPIAQALIDINNVRATIYNTGGLFWRGGSNVYTVPKSGSNNALFASGIWIGGYVGDELRMAGSRYGPWEFWAGPLGDKGEPPDNCEPFDRIWKVSRTDLEAFESEGLTTPDLRDWPTGLGAPTVDEHGLPIDLVDQKLASRIDRKINLAAGERPLLTGDQMLWWITNDRGNVHNAFDTFPIGIEVHSSAFAFDKPGVLENTTFYRFRVFYKGDEPLTETYMSFFSDPDLGAAFDDYVGSDPGLDLGYVYNADPDDDGAYGLDVPALGYALLQGPTVEDNGVDDNGDGRVDESGERMGMTSFMFFVGGGGNTQGDPNTSVEAYNFMRARWGTGEPLTEGGTGLNETQKIVKYVYPGEPGSYWSELETGNGPNTPSDRRFLVTTGPFTFKPGSEQEFIYGIVTSFGGGHLKSVQKLKTDTRIVHGIIDFEFQLARPPDAPDVNVTSLDGIIILEWENKPSSNNFLSQYLEHDPTVAPPDDDYRLEGYNVFRYSSPEDREGELIAVYDVANGVTRVVEQGELTTFASAWGADTGVQHHHIVSGLHNYTDYTFGVQAYAYNAGSIPKVLAGPITRVTATPTRAAARNGGTDIPEETRRSMAEQGADFHTGFDEGDPRRIVGPGSAPGEVAAHIINPESVREGIYSVEFEDAGPFRVYSIKRDGEVRFDGKAAATALGTSLPLGSHVVSIDGMSFSFLPFEGESFRADQVFTFSTAGLGTVLGDGETARAALDQIGIVPNPYRGASDYEVSQLVDQVRFTNLPQVATIRVFTMSGTLVRTLNKNSASATLPWNLTTDDNFPLGSGIYLIHVETEIGSRVIKFGVVKKRVQLNNY